MASSCSPPSAHMDTIKLLQPSTVAPIMCLITEYISMAMLITKISVPRLRIKRIGLMLKEVMPSKAKDSIFRRGYLLSPANLSCLS